ncbi:AKT-interacting protein-like isoform X1 [Tachypleus tridentatus]|uniref:AKT-interacting protein-like isoform X1 n=1 Tax=Tachypleus tridentatus TaxID=6853 RepID=UPI003FD0914A
MSLNMVGQTISPRNDPSYAPFFVEYSLMTEYVMLQRQRLPGVYVVPSAGSPLKWFGVLFIRQGLYQGGVFRFTLYMPDNYPDGDCPLIVFEPSVFHPLINIETGELDVKRGFQKWRRNVNHIWQVILYARRIFYKIENQNPLNPEASVLYERDLELFKVKVAESINFCHEKLYDTSTQDPHALRFSPWEPTIHENVRKKLLSGNKEDNDTKVSTPSGLSWIQKGTLKIFSKTAS